MSSFGNLGSVRDDFRCSLCRQKNAFHCEHDTPCRDKLLGTYDQSPQYPMKSPNKLKRPKRKTEHQENDSSTNYRSRKAINTAYNMNFSEGDSYPQEDRSHNHFGSRNNTNSHGYTNTNGSKQTEQSAKKNKSCVIL